MDINEDEGSNPLIDLIKVRINSEVDKQATRLLGIIQVVPLLRARTIRKAQYLGNS